MIGATIREKLKKRYLAKRVPVGTDPSRPLLSNGYSLINDKIKLIFFDVDGTLLDSQGNYSQRLSIAMHGLKARGIKLALATGRPPFACKFMFKDLPIDDWGLFYTGGLIMSPATEEVFVSHSLDSATCLSVYQAAKAKGCYVELYSSDRLYIDEPHFIAQEHGKQLRVQPCETDISALLRFDKAGGHSELPPPIDVTAGSQPGRRWSKLLIGEDSRTGEQLPLLEQEFPALRFAYAKLPAYPHWRFASVVSEAGDKNQAFINLLNIYGCKAEEVMAFGDAASDKIFLKAAGVGVAMGNASDDVKSSADVVARSSDEDGVARVLEALLEIL